VVVQNAGSYIIGMLAAFVVGLLSLMLLWRVVKMKKLYIFGIYLLFLGITGIIFL
jgi:undecaprenyl pyrophosphate phosphatase UppP